MGALVQKISPDPECRVLSVTFGYAIGMGSVSRWLVPIGVQLSSLTVNEINGVLCITLLLVCQTTEVRDKVIADAENW